MVHFYLVSSPFPPAPLVLNKNGGPREGAAETKQIEID